MFKKKSLYSLSSQRLSVKVNMMKNKYQVQLILEKCVVRGADPPVKDLSIIHSQPSVSKVLHFHGFSQPEVDHVGLQYVATGKNPL